MIPVGPFRITRPLGQGGMGRVWQGVHPGEGLPVAIKVLPPDVARQPRSRAAFRTEIRAVAGLSHPNIVTVYDHGRVTAEEARASDGALLEGSPWLAMELATSGSLAGWYGRLRWPALRRVLAQLLDALAHAHARGVVHRDLKGGNVLLAGPERVVKLADFGLADLEHAEPEDARVMGTPWFMAPEQFAGSRRDQGPWTDLYALGCLAWALCTGGPPFPATAWAEARFSHLAEPVPPLEPRVPVPDGFESWLATLLEKRPHDRFAFAADAAFALSELGDPDDAGRRDADDVADVELPTVHAPTAEATAELLPPDEDLPRPPDAGAREPWPVPPLGSWRAPTPAIRVPPGVGVGLFGLRALPLVGRDAEREGLWRDLDRVRTDRTPRVVVLQGTAGCGASRIARWLGERAHEVGGAFTLRAAHDASSGPSHGLGSMIARHFRALGLDRSALAEHLWAELCALGVQDPEHWRALVEICRPAEPGEAHAVRFESASERYAAIARTLSVITRHRPAVIWLDDAHRDLDALAFAEFALDLPPSQAPSALFVLTVRQDDLPEHPIAEARLDSLVATPQGRRLDVGPLAGPHASALVRTLLGLDDALAGRIEERTGGNPLFAVQLVGDLVQRGLLTPGPRGLSLAPGASLSLPEDLHQVWRARIDRVLAGRPPTDRVALEIGAVLGLEVDAASWRALCGHLGALPSDDLVDTLAGQRLARVNDAGPDVGWTFAHGMLRESVELQARQRDEAAWRRYHALCALQIGTPTDAHAAARLGRHQVCAGHPERALATLLDAAASPDVAPRAAEALLVERERALDALALPRDDRARVEGWLRRAELLLLQGRARDAARWADRVVQTASPHGWDDLLAGGYDALAEALRLSRRIGPSLQARRRAARHAARCGVPRRLAAAVAGIGRLYLDVGNWTEAERAYRRALEIARAHDLAAVEADCLTSLGYLAVRTGGDSDALFADASGAVARSGSRVQRAHLLNAKADLARKRGDFAEAEARCREAMRCYRASGTRAARVMSLNLAMFQVLQGRYTDARDTLTDVLSDEAHHGDAFRAGCHAVMLPCHAALGEWDGWFEHLDALAHGEALVDDDALAMLDLAVRLAGRAGERRRMQAAAKVATRLRARLHADAAIS